MCKEWEKIVALLLSMSLSPQRKKEWIAPTLTVSLLHFFIWWKRNYDRCDNKGLSRPCLDEALLSSLLPLPLLSISSNPLWSYLLSLSSALHPTPLSPSPSCSISCRLMPLAGVAPPFFVRASTIQSGDGIKNQKMSLLERHPGWCTLMSPWKFEIHMLSHFILVPPRSPFPHFSPSVFSLTFLSPSNVIMYYSARKREMNRMNVQWIQQGVCKPFLVFYFLCFHFVK